MGGKIEYWLLITQKIATKQNYKDPKNNAQMKKLAEQQVILHKSLIGMRKLWNEDVKQKNGLPRTDKQIVKLLNSNKFKQKFKKLMVPANKAMIGINSIFNELDAQIQSKDKAHDELLLLVKDQSLKKIDEQFEADKSIWDDEAFEGLDAKKILQAEQDSTIYKNAKHKLPEIAAFEEKVTNIEALLDDIHELIFKQSLYGK